MTQIQTPVVAEDKQPFTQRDPGEGTGMVIPILQELVNMNMNGLELVSVGTSEDFELPLF